jgi:hypothetical protein
VKMGAQGTALQSRQAHRGDGICLCLKPLHAHWAIIIRFDILPLQALFSVEPLDFLRSDAGKVLGSAVLRGPKQWNGCGGKRTPHGAHSVGPDGSLHEPQT